MKNRILITTVFLSNIIFASVLPSHINETNFNKNRVSTFSSAVTLYLFKRGIDKDVAQKKVSDFLVGQDFENDLMIHNILSNFNTLEYDNIVDYIANCALYSKTVDLSSYDFVIGMIQTVNTVTFDELTLQKIEKITLENRKIKQLHSV